MKLPDKQTVEKIRWLAELFDQRQVLTWFDVEPADLIGQVFTPIAFGALKGYTKKQIDSLMVFGLLEDAGPVSINGYPMFMRVYVWRRDDVIEAAKLAQAMEEAKKKVLDGNKI